MRTSEILHKSDTRTWTLYSCEVDYGDWMEHRIGQAWGILFHEKVGRVTTTSELVAPRSNQDGPQWNTKESAMEFWNGLLDGGMDPDTVAHKDIPARCWHQVTEFTKDECEEMKQGWARNS